jgi:hypothetical protein
MTPEEHRKAYEEWLAEHPEYKAALDAEQARIDERMRSMIANDNTA